MKRRVLAFVMALAILFTTVFSGGIFSVSAVKSEQLITDCETLEGWTKTGGGALAINPNGFTGSAIHCDVTNGAFRTATYTAPEPMNISRYQNLTWDAMFHTGGQPGMWEDIASVYGDEVYVKIGSSANDYNIYRLSKMTVEQDAGKNTWYHFSVNLDDPTSTTGTFDPTAMTTFYFSTTDGAVNAAVRSGSVRLDNIYVRNPRPKDLSTLEDVVFGTCDSLEGWSYEGNAANVAINPNGMPGNTVQVFAGYGALRRLTYVTNADLEGYNTIEFEMRVALASAATTAAWDDIAVAYADSIGFEVSDGKAVNVYKLDKWNITELDNCWYHISINLEDPSSTTGSLDLSEMVAITVYTVPGSGAVDTTLPNRNFRFDSFTAHYEPPVEHPTKPLTVADGTEVGAWSYSGNGGVSLVERGGRTVAHVEIGYGALRELTFALNGGIDLTGYNTLEWVMMIANAGTNDVFDQVTEAYSATAKVVVKDSTHEVAFPVSVWNHGAVDSLYHTTSINIGNSDLDLANIVSITFTTAPTGTAAVTSVPNAFVRLDEITALYTETEEPEEPERPTEPTEPEQPAEMIVAEGGEDEAGAWSYTGSGYGGPVDRGGRWVVHVGTTCGALRELKFAPAGGIDLTGYATLEWVMMVANAGTTDVFEAVAEAYKSTAAILVEDGSHAVTFPLSKWQVGEAQNLYRSFAVDLSDSDLELGNIVSITFTTAPTGTAANAACPDAFVRVDEIKATNNEVTPSGYGEQGGGDEPEQPTGPIVISDGSSLENWALESGTLLTNPDQGLPKPSMQVGAGYGALRKLTYTGSLDLTKYPTIEWDWFVMDEVTKGDAFETAIAAYRATTAVEVSDGTTTVVFDLSKWELVSTDGMWRHFAVSLADSGLNLAEIKTVSFYTCPRDGGTVDTSHNNMIYRFDNIQATGSEVTPNIPGQEPDVPTGPIVISDGSSLENWALESGTLLTNPDQGLPKPSMQVGAGYGALRKLTYTGSLDLTKYPTIEWDWFVMDEVTKGDAFETALEAYWATTAVEVSDGTTTVVFDLSKWELVSTDGMWRHFAVSLADSGLNLAEIKTISFYTCPRDGGVLDTSNNNMIYRFDNIQATDSKVTPNMGDVGEKEPWTFAEGNADEASEWSYKGTSGYGGPVERGGRWVVHVGTNYGALRELIYTPTGGLDLTGYNTIEWVMMMATGGTTDVFAKVTGAYGSTTKVIIEDGTHAVEFPLSVWNVGENYNLYRTISVYIGDSDLDLANIKSITFTTAPTGTGAVTTCPDAFVRIDEITAKIAEPGGEEPDDPEGVWTIPGSTDRTYIGTGNGNFSFEIKDFAHNLSGYELTDLYLTLRIYVENLDNPGNIGNLGTDGQLELTSSGGPDVQELNWLVSRLNLVSGWNTVRLSLANSAFNNGLNLEDVNYFRFYAKVSDTATYEIKIEEVKLMAVTDHTAIVSTYFSDGMMFQRNKPMNVFGNAGSAGMDIKAELLDKNGAIIETKESVSAANGSWSVSFTAREGGYDKYAIRLYVNEKLEKTIEDILIGELWLTAGQSNMEYYVIQAMPTYDTPIPTNQYVRFFEEPTVPGGVNAILPSAPATDIPNAAWKDGSVGANAKYVSAIGYFMSLQLQEELNVPVGFIHAAKGASLIESWLPRSVIESNEVIKSTLQARGLYYTEEALEAKTANWENLTTLYNSKIAPFAGVNIAGMLWYHGESNVKYADDSGDNAFYAEAIKALIETYSKDFGFAGDMPFVYAHLAPHDYSTAAGRAQDYQTILANFAEMLSETVGKVDAQMIQIPLYDLSLQYKDPPVNNPDPIHPNSKIELAGRFASAVLAGVYGIGDADAQTAPTVSSWKVEGNKIVLTYANVGSEGLKILNESADLTGFAIAGSDRVFVKATARIVGKNKVELYSDAVAAPVAATYAWTSFNMRSNLANAAGIPAVPYRTDKVASTYYLSMDWADFDSETVWVNLTTLDAGFKPAYTTSENAAVTADTQDKLEGKAAICLAYTLSAAGAAKLAPVLNYHGMVNQYSAYTGLTLHVKNPDSRAKQLALEITASGDTYYATVIAGETLATAYELAAGGYAEYTFNLTRLVNDEGKVLADSTPILKAMTALSVCVGDTDDGRILLDNAFLRADKLPAPGSDNDDVVSVEDTTPGSLDADGNMWLSAAESTSGWSANGAEVVVDTEKYTQGKSSVGATAAGGVLKQIAYVPGVSLDISEYNYLEFDVYFSNMKWFDASNMMFEMTSSGGPDVDSNRWMKGQMSSYAPELYDAAVAQTDKPGWYHVKLTINSPQGNGRGSMDTTRFNFFRFYSIGAPDGTPDYEIRIDNMKFTKDEVPEKDPSYGKVIDSQSMWMTDGDSVGYWRATGAEVMLAAARKTQGSNSISVTAKNGVLKQIAFIPDHAINVSGYQYLEFDVYFSNLSWYFAGNSTMFELTSAGTSDVESSRYTKSSMLEACPEFAADVEAGYGGGKWYHFKLNLDTPHAKVRGGLNKANFNFFRFYVVEVAAGTPDFTMYLDNLRFTKGKPVPPLEKTDEHIIINNCDSSSGWSSPGQEVMPDTNNKVSGTASVTVTAKGGILKELVYRPSEPIDLTGYRYLQFDLFLSDITCLETSTGFMVELTSSGTCDVASNRYMKSTILLACPELAEDWSKGDVGNKWYHFCFDLEKPQNQANGGLDMTAFNYFRIYFIGSPAGTPDCVVNVDNLMVTVTGVSTPDAPPSQGGQIIFPNGGGSASKNIGNKVNGGLRGDSFAPLSAGLVTAVAAMGGATVLLLLGAIVLLILSQKQKKRNSHA